MAVVQDVPCEDIWIYLLQSGLKLRFSGFTQQLNCLEVYLVDREDAPLTKRVPWTLKGQSLTRSRVTLEGIEQIMY